MVTVSVADVLVSETTISTFSFGRNGPKGKFFEKLVLSRTAASALVVSSRTAARSAKRRAVLMISHAQHSR